MQYYLCLKDEPLLLFEISNFEDIEIKHIYDRERLPFCIKVREASPLSLYKWLKIRSASAKRSDIKALLANQEMNLPIELTLKNHALSLTDPYCIKGLKENFSYEQYRFDKNNFHYGVGNFLIGRDADIVFPSPDICTNGNQPKVWRTVDGEKMLLKFGTAPFYQEPSNEIISSIIAKDFPVLNAVEYKEGYLDGNRVSVCKNFLQEDEELVTLNQFYAVNSGFTGNIYFDIIQQGKAVGLYNIESYIRSMICLDLLLNNRDRNLGNVAMIRDTKTGYFVRMANLYDFGKSLWATSDVDDIIHNPNDTYKLFKNTIDEELSKLSKKIKFKNIDFNKYSPLIYTTLEKNQDKKRVDKIITEYEKRCNYIISKVLPKEKKKENVIYV